MGRLEGIADALSSSSPHSPGKPELESSLMAAPSFETSLENTVLAPKIAGRSPEDTPNLAEALHKTQNRSKTPLYPKRKMKQKGNK